MTKRMIIVLLACGVVFGAVFGMKWFGNRMMNQYIDAMPIPPATVSSAKATATSWPNQLSAIGTLVPVNGADVTVEVGGIVTQVHFESGASVKKGDRLLTLDSAAEAGEMRRLRAQADLAELNRVRREKLWKLEAISKSDYDAAVSEANAAKAAFEGQSATLGKKEIRAPFDGQLGIRRVNVGEYLQPGTAIVTLQSLDPIELDFELPEQYIAGVAPGYTVQVAVDSYPDRVFSGEVLAVEPRVNQATRNFGLRARLPNSELQLKPGQFARVHLSLPGERKVLVVPRTAISYSSYGTSVFVIQKKPAAQPNAEGAKPAAEAPAAGTPPASDLQVTQRFVKLGDARGDYVAIVEGLKADEEIASSGLLKLRNEQPVIINNSIQPELNLNPNPAES